MACTIACIPAAMVLASRLSEFSAKQRKIEKGLRKRRVVNREVASKSVNGSNQTNPSAFDRETQKCHRTIAAVKE
jgi:hypothetical protein